MEKEEFYRIKLKNMYVKDFKTATIHDSENHWRLRREVVLINNEEDGIPVLKEDAQAIMGWLGNSCVLEKFEEE